MRRTPMMRILTIIRELGLNLKATFKGTLMMIRMRSRLIAEVLKTRLTKRIRLEE
jgi:hypothetical protein